MGCVASKLDINDVHPNIFAVNNVDDMGTKLSSGQLEITETDLILYQKGKQPVKWPLKYLKRYGFEAGLFSFEAGRKTPTGPGVYAFKCRRAEKLFNLLQVRVREQGPDRSSMSVASTPAQLPDDPLTPSSPVSSDTGQDPSYINVDIGDNGAPVVTTIPPSGHPGYLNITQELPNTAVTAQDLRHEYENIGPDTQVPAHSPSYIPPRNMFFLPPKPPHLIPQHTTTDTPANSDAKDEVTSDENDNMERNDSVIESINYIVLDLDQGKSSPPPQSPSVPSVAAGPVSARGYVTIDFDKTDALIKSANQRYFEDDPGIRKTRHNSSLSELTPGPQASSK